ncbi:NAD-dependent epimerase/dehydratase family protein [Flavobacteriaceae bacterium]|nr:NAD-dependent epimerase/dehydratase family protein [Flavobacteriaceae bacterium]
MLVTGAAGFIGFHLCERLLKAGHSVLGLDNINAYYDVNLKYDRLKALGISRSKAERFDSLVNSEIFGDKFQFIRLNLEDREALPEVFKSHQFDSVCSLAAQGGVRNSNANSESYIDSNITGFLNVLECCRQYKITRLVYASSSSVYGNCNAVPFKETAVVDQPISLYAATKRANELMAHTYSHLYNIETIGLRFFTVYGPWGRPDMALFLFTKLILNDQPIKVFNDGNLSRDFTYIDDIIDGVEATLLKPSKNNQPYKLYNIGNCQPVQLLDFIKAIEKSTGKRAEKLMLPMQAGDVNQTWANVEQFKTDYDYQPSTSVQTGIKAFVSWYLAYYN